MFRINLTAMLTAITLAGALPVFAQDTKAADTQGATPRVGITSDMAEATYTTPQGETVTVSRDQTPGATLQGDWALTGHDCPPFCIQPMSPAPGVTTISELELIEAMKAGDTTLVDGRTSDWYQGGTIPGAINVPYTEAVERLATLGCEPEFEGKFDCATAHKVIMFCNGPWCGQSPSAIRSMIEAGFPVDRISYYRGGMLEWRLLGLTVAGGATTGGAVTDTIANPVVEATTEEATTQAGTDVPVAGEATAQTPLEGNQPADKAMLDNAENAESADQATTTDAAKPAATTN